MSNKEIDMEIDRLIARDEIDSGDGSIKSNYLNPGSISWLYLLLHGSSTRLIAPTSGNLPVSSQTDIKVVRK